MFNKRQLSVAVKDAEELLREVEQDLYLPPRYRRYSRSQWEKVHKPRYVAYLQREIENMKNQLGKDHASKVQKVVG